MKNLIEYFVKFIFHIFDLVIKRKTFIVFSCRAAKDYADNSKALFEFFLSKNIDNVYFFTKKKNVLKKIPKNGIYAYSFLGIYILLRARILIFTHGIGDFFPYYPRKLSNRIFINLFHAIAVKKVGHNSITSKVKEAKEWDFFSVSSEFEARFIKEQYTLVDNQIIITGQPRNDILTNQTDKNSNSKLILYAPTFRDNSITKLFPFDDRNLESLDKILGELNTKIMIRIHINEEFVYKKSKTYESLKNIFFAGSSIYPSVNEILHKVDGLITDYSSIALDFLLLNRPIAYITYDFNEYKKVRGFSFDFNKHKAGPILKSQMELLDFIKLENDLYQEKRETLKKIFHKYDDGKSSERLYKLIKEL